MNANCLRAGMPRIIACIVYLLVGVLTASAQDAIDLFSSPFTQITLESDQVQRYETLLNLPSTLRSRAANAVVEPKNVPTLRLKFFNGGHQYLAEATRIEHYPGGYTG
jgi:hypothetical protein